VCRALLIVVGLGWLFVLPLDEFSRGSYISENALLPGQVEAYFGGSELNKVRAYRKEVESWASSSEDSE
jgi:GPI-anchor transamidase subunit GAA1